MAALAFMSCRQLGPPPEPIDLIPVNANLVAVVHPGKIREIDAVRRAWEASSAWYAETVSKQEALWDWEFFPKRRAVVFTDVTATNTYGAAIFQEPIDEAALLDRLGAGMGLTFSESIFSRDGSFQHPIHTSGTDDESLTVAFFESNITAIGTREAVLDVAGVYHRDRPPLSGPGLDAMDQSGDPLISLALIPSPEVLARSQGVLSSVPLGGVLPLNEVFGNTQVITLAVFQEGNSFRVDGAVHFDDLEAAANFGETVTGLLSLAAGFTTDPQLRDLANGIEVQVTRGWVTITSLLTEDELSQLLARFPAG